MRTTQAMHRWPLALLPLMLVATLAGATAGSALANEDSTARTAGAGAPLTEAEGPTDPAELESFLDDLMAHELQEYHIPGAAVAVVKDGELFFAKGYGFADLENRIPVDAEETIFRIGSIGKLITWTAVMQQVEQGNLDLDENVNTYLDFRIPDTYPEPITIRHLMAHTTGFEDKLLGSVVKDGREPVPASEWIAAYLPARIHPPGEGAAYSNYNAMLAGYIVSRVSGEPYDEYVDRHIYAPLGMTRSSVHTSVPPALEPFVAVGYTYDDGAFEPFPTYVGVSVGGVASGMHIASVTDMARFMIAHLEGGAYRDASGEGRILQEPTARQMQTTLFTPDPRLRGTAHGFFDFSDHGQFTLGASGYFPQTHSLLLLLPDQHLGVFVSYNGDSSDGLVLQHFGFQKAFFDHYYPAPAVMPVQSPAGFAQRASRYTGSYRVFSSPHTTLIKFVELFGAYRAEISDPGDGTLVLSAYGAEARFAEVEPLYFRQVDGSMAMIFREDAQGRITQMHTDMMPQYGTVKLKWYDATGFNVALMMGCLLLFVSMILAAIVGGILARRNREQKTELQGARIARWILLTICVLDVFFVIGIMQWGQPETELGSVSLITKVLAGLGVLSAALTVGAVLYSVLAWKNRYWQVGGRAHYTLTTLAAVGFVWFLNYWNLLGWRY